MDNMAGKKEGEVSQELQGLDKALSLQSEEVDALEMALSIVLRPLDETKNVGEPQEQLVALAHSIRQYRQRLERHTEILGAIRFRLEL